MTNIKPKSPKSGQRPYWQERAIRAGLAQKTLAKILGHTEVTVSHQLRELYGATPRHVVATILAWEQMSPEQRQDWMALLEGRSLPTAETRPPSRRLSALREAAKHERERLGLTREQVAASSGLTRRKIIDFEAGADVTLSDADRIGEALGLTIHFVSAAELAGISTATARRQAPEEGFFDSFGLDLPDDIAGEQPDSGD